MKKALLLLLAAPGLRPAQLACQHVAAPHAASDSLRIEILRLGVREAEIEADRTDLWRRLMPRVDVSASFSAGEIVFADPEAAGGYLLPDDSYRLSIGIRLSELLDGGDHERALAALERRRAELRLAVVRMEEDERSARHRRAQSDSARSLLDEELSLRSDVVRFYDLLFRQGKGDWSALLRAKLALLAAKKSRLQHAESREHGAEEP